MTKCCLYTSGMLREPIVFERKILTGDGKGAQREAWTAIAGAPTRARVTPMSGGERWQSQRVEATATHKIVVRYHSGITEKDRAVVRGRAYNIRFIADVDFARRWLEITAEVGVAV